MSKPMDDDLIARKLRADLDEATKQHMPAIVVKTLRATLARITQLETELAEARNAALEEAAKACEAGRLSDPQDESDAAYNRAIDHCAQAIRDMKDRHSPTPPPV